MNESPLFSIITVTYNAEAGIERTLQSVYSQTCKDYEYIIVDGESKDKTCNIISAKTKLFLDLGINYYFISEKDNGIYDAMNKGIKMSTGKWVCFMNAGDHFLDSNVLETVKKADIENKNIGIIYGDRQFYKSNGLIKVEKTVDLRNINEEMPFSHQSCFAKRALLIQHPFDKSFPIGADYEFVMWCYVNDVKFFYVGRVISETEYGGVSTSEGAEIQMLRERIEIQKLYKVYGEDEYNNKLVKLDKYRKHRELTAKIKRYIPSSLIDKREYYLDLKNGWHIERKI